MRESKKPGMTAKFLAWTTRKDCGMVSSCTHMISWDGEDVHFYIPTIMRILVKYWLLHRGTLVCFWFLGYIQCTAKGVSEIRETTNFAHFKCQVDVLCCKSVNDGFNDSDVYIKNKNKNSGPMISGHLSQLPPLTSSPKAQHQPRLAGESPRLHLDCGHNPFARFGERAWAAADHPWVGRAPARSYQHWSPFSGAFFPARTPGQLSALCLSRKELSSPHSLKVQRVAGVRAES